MLHPDTELRFVSNAIGVGVFATKLIPKGAITWVHCALDQTFTPAAVAGLSPLHKRVMDKYSFVDGRGNHILCWDHGRFVNHSCEPTCLSPGMAFEIAVRDIHPGQEVTDDYGSLNLDTPFHCLCGSPHCRGQIMPDDPVRLTRMWDEQINEAILLVRRVHQPMWELMRETDREVLGDIVAGRVPVPSSVSNYAKQHMPMRQAV